jgi:hypothetical protein
MPDAVRIVVERREPVHIFWVAVLVVLIVAYWQWILLGCALIGVATWLVLASRAERQRIAELQARADEQHRWVFKGDERGTYGHDWKGYEGPQQPTAPSRGPVPKPCAQRQRAAADGGVRP